MKKVLMILLVLLMLTYPLAAYASENNDFSESKITLTTEGKTFFDSVIDKKQKAIVANKDLYRDDLKDFEPEGKTFIPLYGKSMYGMSNLSYEKMLEEQKAYTDVRYLAINGDSKGEVNVLAKSEMKMTNGIRDEENGVLTITVGLTRTDSITNPYIQDILDLQDGKINILGEERNITNFYCVDNMHVYYGIITYFETTEGVFVKYYNGRKQEGVEFTLSDYEEYFRNYLKDLTANNIDPDTGEEILGGGPGILSNTPDDSSESDKPINLAWILIPSAVGIMIILSIVFGIKAKKHR